MREDTVQIIVALVLVNMVAWGGYVILEKEPETVYKYRNPIANSANVTVTIDFTNYSANATTFANMTIVSFENIVVKNDTSAYAATITASRANNFSIEVTWYSFGPYLHTIDGVSNDNYYWGLYHNGNYSMVGAGDLQLQDDDVILWKYEAPNW
jgi:hypothetical protein